MKILFLTYVNRSGSTFLANLLSSSEDVFACLEGDRLVSLFLEDPGKAFTLSTETRTRLSDIFGSDAKLILWSIGEDVFNYLGKAGTNFEAFCSVLEYSRDKVKPGATLVVFKAERLAAILNRFGKLALLPDREPLILSLFRDPRAVIASQMNTRNPFSDQLLAACPVRPARWWSHYCKQVLRFSENSENLLMVKFEELPGQLESTLKGISVFTTINLNNCGPGKGDLMTRISDAEKMIHPHVGNPPDIDRIVAWKDLLSDRELYLIEKICRPYMIEMDYDLSVTKFNIFLEIYILLSFAVLNIKDLLQKIRFQLRLLKF